MPTNRITAILNGQRAATGDTALRLADLFGTSAEFWLNLQKNFTNYAWPRRKREADRERQGFPGNRLIYCLRLGGVRLPTRRLVLATCVVRFS